MRYPGNTSDLVLEYEKICGEKLMTVIVGEISITVSELRDNSNSFKMGLSVLNSLFSSIYSDESANDSYC